MSDTQAFSNFDRLARNEAKEIMLKVCMALKDKGYNPVNQIVGYIMSGDPTYITSFKDARALICKLERDELLEELVTFYIKNNLEA
jgi:uncharacterized protein (UPF0297 family)